MGNQRTIPFTGPLPAVPPMTVEELLVTMGREHGRVQLTTHNLKAALAANALGKAHFVDVSETPNRRRLEVRGGQALDTDP